MDENNDFKKIKMKNKFLNIFQNESWIEIKFSKSCPKLEAKIHVPQKLLKKMFFLEKYMQLS